MRGDTKYFDRQWGLTKGQQCGFGNERTEIVRYPAMGPWSTFSISAKLINNMADGPQGIRINKNLSNRPTWASTDNEWKFQKLYHISGSSWYHPFPAVTNTKPKEIVGMIIYLIERTHVMDLAPGRAEGTTASWAPRMNIWSETLPVSVGADERLSK